ncbi:MAG: redoxin domain-containing protein [Acidobacteria bacterium]|nr:redoxin domain-containing protein [Acidobacteriota bacterium]
MLFLSTLCPISNDYNDRMSSLYNEYAARGIEFFFVNANNNESPAEVAAHAKAAEFPFPVFKDPGNALADRLGATLTPEAYLFDAGGVLRYHGQIDDSRNPARVRVHGLRDALDQVLASKPVSRQETKAFGCTIKRVRKAS